MKNLRVIGLVTIIITLLTLTVFAAGDDVHTFDSKRKPNVYSGKVVKGTSSDGGITYSYDDSFTVSMDGLNPNSEYVLLQVKAQIDSSGNLEAAYDISAENIVYVDQKSSDAGGEILFEVFPMQVDNSIFLLGGTFPSEAQVSPLKLGAVFEGEITGFDFSGVVKLGGREANKMDGVAVSLISSGGDIFSTTTNVWGDYSLSNVPSDTYKLMFDRASYLSYEKTALNIESADIEYKTVTLKGGDIVKDGQVTSSDLSNLLGAYLSNTTAPADINGDGQVTSSDLSILLSNYLASKTVE